MKKLQFAALAALSWHLCGAAAPSLPTLNVKSPLGPGGEYFRAAEQQLADHAGVKLVLDEPRTPWAVEATVLDKPAERAAIAAGKYATTIYRHLTPKEKAAGLAETVLGYYGAVLVTHPSSPIDNIDLPKWKAYVGAKSEPALKWSTIAVLPAGAKDGPVVWSLPGVEHKAWPQAFSFVGAFPARLTASFQKGVTLDPDDAAQAVAKLPNGIAMHGFDLVMNRQNSVFSPIKVLKVGGVEPTRGTLGDETYPLARPVVFVYSAAQAADASSAIAKVLAWHATPLAKQVATERQLVLPRAKAVTSH